MRRCEDDAVPGRLRLAPPCPGSWFAGSLVPGADLDDGDDDDDDDEAASVLDEPSEALAEDAFALDEFVDEEGEDGSFLDDEVAGDAVAAGMELDEHELEGESEHWADDAKLDVDFGEDISDDAEEGWTKDNDTDPDFDWGDLDDGHRDEGAHHEDGGEEGLDEHHDHGDESDDVDLPELEADDDAELEVDVGLPPEDDGADDDTFVR